MTSTITSLVKRLLAFSQADLKGDKTTDVQRLVCTTEEAQILQAVDYTATRNSDQLLSLLKVICAGLTTENPASRMKRKHLVKTMIELLRQSRLDTHVSSGILCTIFTEVDFLKDTDIQELLGYYRKTFARDTGSNISPQFLEIFPKLLHTLSTFEVAHGSETTGRQMRDRFLKEFCGCDKDDVDDISSATINDYALWHPSAVAHILVALKEAALTPEEKDWVALKTVGLLPKVPADEVPVVVYHLLALVAEGPKNIAFHGICDFFGDYHDGHGVKDATEERATSAAEWQCLKANEGLIILHFMHTVRQNRDAGNQLINVLKSRGDRLFSTFCLGLLLALSQSGTRLKDQALDVAKTAILRFLKVCERKEASVWIESLLPSGVNLEEVVKEIAENSEVGCGWEYSLNGLYEIGFMLMETHLSKIFILSSGKLMVESSQSAAYNACLLGKAIVDKSFDKCGVEKRHTIIERVFSLITGATTGSCGSPLFIIGLLAGLVCRGMTAFLSYEERIVSMFDLLPTLPSEVAVPMLKALLPVVKLSHNLRDTLIRALKKGLFSIHTETRKTAVGGLLLFLKHFKIMNAFKSARNDSNNPSYWHSFPTFGTQVPSDTNPQRSNYERLCLEVIGCLRRTLCQQEELKKILYHGLCLVIRRNVSTLQPIVDFLYRHLQNYLESDADVVPPFKLDNCVNIAKDAVTVLEAFGDLIYALNRALKQAEDDHKKILNKDIVSDSACASEDVDNESQCYFDYNVMTRVRKTLWNLATRVSSIDLEDFALDKTADFSPNITGEANFNKARILLSTYEALIGFVWSFYDFKHDSAETILSLHNCHCKLKFLLQEKVHTKGKKAAVTAGTVAVTAAAGRPFKCNENSSANDSSTLDLICMHDLALRLLFDKSPNRREGLEPLRSNEEFVRWVFETILAQTTKLCSRQKTGTSKSFETICKVSSIMLQYFVGAEEVVDKMKQPIFTPLKGIALDIVATIMDAANLHFSDKMDEAAQIWGGALGIQSQGLSQQIHASLTDYGTKFHGYLKDFLRSRVGATPRKAAEDKDADIDVAAEGRSPRHLLTMIKIINSVWAHFSPKSNQYRDAYNFLLRLCEEQPINDAAVGKHLWHMMLRMHRRYQGGCVELALTLSQNIRFCYGDLIDTDDDDAEAQPGKFYASVSARTATSATTVLISYLEECRDDCAFLVEHVRRSVKLAKNRKDGTWTANEQLENAVASQLKSLGEVWQVLLATQLPESQVRAAIKYLRVFFDTCTDVVRYYSLLYQKKMSQITPMCTDLFRFLADNLTTLSYKFIGHAKCGNKDTGGACRTSKKPSATIAKQALHEMKEVPCLIFAMEKFEECLVELSRKCKQKTLINRVYFGHARDFKIDYDKCFNAEESIDNDEGQQAEAEARDEMEEIEPVERERNQRQKSAAGRSTKRKQPKGEKGRPPKQKRETSP